MPRASRAAAQEHRAQMVRAAARLLREKGPEAVTVTSVTKAAGMTQGAFYKQFASKDALVAEACQCAAQNRKEHLAAIGSDDGDEPRKDARCALISAYLSEVHRDSPADGCPVSSLVSDAARSDDHAFRLAYSEAVRDLLDSLQRVGNDGRQGALLDLVQLVGALTLARAVDADTSLSAEILSTARGALGREPAESGEAGT